MLQEAHFATAVATQDGQAYMKSNPHMLGNHAQTLFEATAMAKLTSMAG
jgi:hypothetical protein